MVGETAQPLRCGATPYRRPVSKLQECVIEGESHTESLPRREPLSAAAWTACPPGCLSKVNGGDGSSCRLSA